MEGQKWVRMMTAQTPSNIAIVKYWGKRDETLILPINDSISVTLDPNHICTTTTVAVSPAFQSDRFWLNGKEISVAGDRYQNCLREIRKRASDVEDEENGTKISKKDWQNLHFHIASYNNFPTSAGLASSAAGFACLVFALAKLMNVKEDQGQLSAIARQGSGSACRSLFGGFVKWIMGNDDNGSDSLAVQTTDEKHWDDLVILIAVVSSRQKETSSTSGMRQSMETSLLLKHRAQEIVPKRILQMEEAIKNKDFASFAAVTCAESNQFHAVCLDTSPPLFYISCGAKCCPNRTRQKCRLSASKETAVLLPSGGNTDLTSYVLGDKSILEDAAIKDMKDVESLPPPPEAKDGALPEKCVGDVTYFICTRPGRAPVLLSDETLALLDPQTGFPK